MSAAEKHQNESGWACDLPASWRRVPLRRFAKLKTGHTPSRNVAEYWVDCSIPWVTLGDVAAMRDGSRKFIAETKECISQLGLENSAAELLPTGTVILSRTASVGFAAVLALPMATTQDFVNWVCSAKLDASYLFWVFQAMRPEFARLTNGSVHKTIYMPDVAKFQIPLPPSMSEQRAIADLLDRETAEADALVAKYERLIELLDEKRAALITKAVTKGLDPTAPMKDSGTLWLGQIPATWALLPFRYCGLIAEGQVDPSADRNRDEYLIAPDHIESGTGRLITLETAAEQGAISGKYRVRKGDIVFSKIRPALAKVTRAPFDCLCSADMYPIRASIRVNPEFLRWAMLSRQFVSFTTEVSMRVAMPKINREALAAIPMAVPPLVEQKEIVNYLNAEVVVCEKTKAAARRAIALLQERRSAVVAAAVTGQIDVNTYRSKAARMEAPA